MDYGYDIASSQQPAASSQQPAASSQQPAASSQQPLDRRPPKGSSPGQRKYGHLSKEELIGLLERRDATRKLGLVWERDEIEHDAALNDDFVALDFDESLSLGQAPYSDFIIEGDNFDALRYLGLAYKGRVRCIYIDPPYNTGNKDFVYNDRFVDRDDGYRHSKWLEFMYRRLKLAKDLLAEDGVIVVSIDDNEVFHLGLLMQQIFSERNRIATCIWQKRYSRENREAIGDAHEYLLVYALDPERFKAQRGRIALGDKQRALYKNPDKDPKGPWQSVSISAQGYRPNQMYEIVAPNGKRHAPPEGRCWSLIEDEFNKLRKDGRIFFGADGNGVPRRKYYLSEADGLVPWTWWPHEEVGHTDEARKEIQDILGTQTAFDTPKPVRLIKRVLHIATRPGDLVLDFFAGSGTTAHAVAKLNKEAAAKGLPPRHYILVSSTEATGDRPNKNVCRDVCAERVRRVAQGYNNKKGQAIPGLGGSFAYLRCSRIPLERLHTAIRHDQVWVALQQLHAGVVSPYTEGEFHALEVADVDLYYVARISQAVITTLEERLRQKKPAVVYAWQPGLLRQRLGDGHIVFEKIPAFLVDRFGGGR